MACCICHTHPDGAGECCQLCNCKELKKNTEKLLQVENSNNEKPKKKGWDFGDWFGLGVFALGVAVIAVFICSATIPGFLKPDQEVPLLEVSSFVSQDGGCLVKFRWRDRDQDALISIDQIGVVLRNDGKSCTTVVLKNRKYSDSYDCSSVTILVSSGEDLEKWNRFFDSLKLKYKKEKEARDLFSNPHYVPPPYVITK